MKINPYWLSGFIDGEGCFYVGINKHKTMAIGYQVLAEFRLVQHGRDQKLLHAIKEYFECGSVVKNRGKNSDEEIYEYRLRSIQHLRTKLIPFIEKHPLMTTKKYDYAKFKEILELISKEEHLTLEGLEKIKTLKSKMNKGSKGPIQTDLTTREEDSTIVV